MGKTKENSLFDNCCFTGYGTYKTSVSGLLGSYSTQKGKQCFITRHRYLLPAGFKNITFFKTFSRIAFNDKKLSSNPPLLGLSRDRLNCHTTLFAGGRSVALLLQ